MSRIHGPAIAVILAGVVLASCSKPTADDHFRKGNEHVDQSRLSEATMEYRLALQVDPRRGDVRLKLADTLFRMRDGGGALNEYVRAADLLPQNADAQLKAGGLLLMASAYEDAKARAQAALKLDPKNVEALLLLGNALAGLKDLDGALAEYQEALVLNPALDAAYASIGAIQAARGQQAEAEATFRKAVDAAPESSTARMALANFLWASKRAPEAEQVLKDALALNPADLAANRALGMFYMASGRAAEAEPYFRAIAETAKTTEASISLADYYTANKRYDDAKAVLEPLSKQDEAFAIASVRLAAIEAMQNNRTVAHTRVRDVLKRYPKEVAARLLEARLLLADGKPDDALSMAEAILKDDPQPADAAHCYMLIGSIQTARDRTDEAIRAYEEVLKRQSQPLAAQLALASLHFGAGALDKAQSYAQQALSLQPRNPVARAQLVRIGLAKGEFARAGAEIAALEKEFPNAPQVLNLVAARHQAERRLDAARAAYLKVETLAPNDLEALNGLVSLDLAGGRKADALARLEGALKRMPPTTSLLLLAARAYLAAGDSARAEALLKQAIDVDPSRLTAYGRLGQLYISQKRLPEAETQFKQLIQKNPSSVSANTMLGIILEAQRRLPEAETQYQRTLGIDPRAAVAANNLAWLFVTSNRNLDQALQLAQTAQQQLPDNPNVNDTLGWVFYRKNLTPQAIRHLELSLQRDNTDPMVHYHLGMAYLQAGYVDRAKKTLQDALAPGREFDGVQEARTTLAKLGGGKD